MNKKVCVVVPVFNRLDKTIQFIESFKASRYTNYTIVIVDDASSDKTNEYIKTNYPEIVLLNGDGNLWWSGGTNLGVTYAIANNYDYVLTVNNDSRVDPNFLTELVDCAEINPDSIVGGSILSGETDRIWSLGVLVSFGGAPFLHLNKFDRHKAIVEYMDNPLEMKALTGNGVLVPTAIYRKIGLYDQKWCPQYHGDTEFTYRATKQGYRCLVNTKAVIYNNHFVANQNLNVIDSLLSKKSALYWRPVLKFYFSHAPLKFKPFVLLQFLWIPKRIIKVILKKLSLA